MIRITGGIKRGQSLFTKKDHELRPTSGKVKSAIFNILGEKIQQAHFLDLFAGSGSVGIEALSRGAGHCTFVEKNTKHIQLIRKNIERMSYQNSSTLLCIDAIKFKQLEGKFNIIFADPPYSSGLLEKVLPDLGGSDMIHNNGILIIEHFKKRELSSDYGLFSIVKRYSYGDTFLSLYQYKSVII